MLIGLTGVKRSGKSTAAARLEACGFRRTAFADPLKEMLAALGLTQEQLYGGEKEVPLDLLCGHTPRTAMQTLGTEWGRACLGEALWRNAWRARVRAIWAANPTASVVVEDVRFPDEVAEVKALGGVVLRIWRPSLCAGVDLHASEREILGLVVDAVVLNDGDMALLGARVRAAVARYGRAAA